MTNPNYTDIKGERGFETRTAALRDWFERYPESNKLKTVGIEHEGKVFFVCRPTKKQSGDNTKWGIQAGRKLISGNTIRESKGFLINENLAGDDVTMRTWTVSRNGERLEIIRGVAVPLSYLKEGCLVKMFMHEFIDTAIVPNAIQDAPLEVKSKREKAIENIKRVRNKLIAEMKAKE